MNNVSSTLQETCKSSTAEKDWNRKAAEPVSLIMEYKRYFVPDRYFCEEIAAGPSWNRTVDQSNNNPPCLLASCIVAPQHSRWHGRAAGLEDAICPYNLKQSNKVPENERDEWILFDTNPKSTSDINVH